MEAARFGLDGFDPRTPPDFKVKPTDGDIIAHYLLLRALGLPDPPFAHAVIDDDACSLPPEDLLAKHGHAGSSQAFFLDSPDVSKNAGRRDRIVRGKAGGLWQGQKSTFRTFTLLRSGGGDDIDIRYKRYDLTYKCKAEPETGEAERDSVVGKRKRKASAKDGDPTGWVMHEYQIVSPPLQATVLSRIKITAAKIKKGRLQAAAAAQHPEQEQQPRPRLEVLPVQEQPNPGFDPSSMPPSFKFDPRTPPAFKDKPTDNDMVAHYLFQRALGLPDPPFAHTVIDDDPCSLPPQDLFAKHGQAGSHEVFFLDTPIVSKNAGHMHRIVKGGAGGVWCGQRTTFRSFTLLRPGCSDVSIRYKRYYLTFCSAARANGGGSETTDWVMHQYQVVSPPLQATVLSHIKVTAAKIKKDQLQAAAAAQHQQVLEQPLPASQEQPGPRLKVLPLQELPGPGLEEQQLEVFTLQELSGARFEEQPELGAAMTLVPELASPSHQVHPGPSHEGGSSQTYAPCSDMGELDCSLYAHDADNLCNLNFTFFGGEWELSPIKSQLGFFQTILGI